jgi:DNA-binding transcriptional ArsR family regulator
MSGSEEEAYSLMFSSLRHPARRKILRMLSEAAMSFSQMLEVLAIPSSHLTYHLENLGELLVKEKDGRYKLSSFGKAAVSMMKGAEEVPNIQAKRFSALPLRWKTLYAVFIMAILLLATFSFVQHTAINQLSSNYDLLKVEYDKIQAQNEQLLSWSTSASKSMSIIRDVIQLDTSKYQAALDSNIAESRADIGNVIEELIKYSFVNVASKLELTLRFRNNHLSLFQLNQLEGFPNYPPLYTVSQSRNILQACRGFLDRYNSVMDEPYLEEMSMLIASVDQTNVEQTLGNTKVRITAYGENAEILFYYTENGTDFEAKHLLIVFQNHFITEIIDDWNLFKIGTAQVNISRDQAIQIAIDAAKAYSWNSGGDQISDFEILDSPVSAEFYPHAKTSYLTLVPYWYVILHLDRTYPGGVNIISVGVWADTGEVANIQALVDQAST